MSSVILIPALQEHTVDPGPMQMVDDPPHHAFAMPLSAQLFFDDDILDDTERHVGLARERNERNADKAGFVARFDHALPEFAGWKPLKRFTQALGDFRAQNLLDVLCPFSGAYGARALEFRVGN